MARSRINRGLVWVHVAVLVELDTALDADQLPYTRTSKELALIMVGTDGMVNLSPHHYFPALTAWMAPLQSLSDNPMVRMWNISPATSLNWWTLMWKTRMKMAYSNQESICSSGG